MSLARRHIVTKRNTTRHRSAQCAMCHHIDRYRSVRCAKHSSCPCHYGIEVGALPGRLDHPKQRNILHLWRHIAHWHSIGPFHDCGLCLYKSTSHTLCVIFTAHQHPLLHMHKKSTITTKNPHKSTDVLSTTFKRSKFTDTPQVLSRAPTT